MDPENNLQPIQSNPNKAVHIILGIFVGIIQAVFMFFFCLYFGGVSYVLFNFLGGFAIVIVFLLFFLPLILEAFLLRKNYSEFVRGVLIGTFLAPLIGLGYCFLYPPRF